LSLALCNLRLQESLRIQSIRDPLTSLYNRRYLEESLEREVVRCGRRNLPMAVMMIDIDHFKRFNDAHGHDGGDALLVQFAALLQAHCRGEDIACRFGGEEFTLIIPETSTETAMARAEQIRAAAENLRVTYQKSQLSPVSVSIGVAGFPKDGQHGDDLIHSADVALYRAKHEGRNRVVAA
jgi:diguanylate cyclase (GGDEF)-like protein